MEIKDKYKEGMTLKEMKDFIETVKVNVKEFEMLSDFVRAVISPCLEGYTLTISQGHDFSLGIEGTLHGGATLKSARGYFRIFKTIEPVQKIAYDLGFEKCVLWNR